MYLSYFTIFCHILFFFNVTFINCLSFHTVPNVAGAFFFGIMFV